MPALQGSRAISGAVTPTTNDDGWSLRVTANATVTLTNSGWTVGRSGMFFPVVGAATVTFQAGASVTVRNVAGDLVQDRQYDGATALYTGTNEWTIYGSEDPPLPDGYVTLAKLADLATDRIIGRVSSGTGVPQALTPAQGREVLQVAGPVVNAADYASLQDAIDAAEATSTGMGIGQSVYASGTYEITTGLTLDVSKTRLIGDGLVIDATGMTSGAALTLFSSSTAVYGQTVNFVDGVSFVGPGDDSDVDGVLFESASGNLRTKNAKIDRCAISEFRHGIVLGSRSYLTGGSNLEVWNCAVCVYTTTGLFDAGEKWTFIDCVFFNSALAVRAHSDGASSIVFIACSFDYNSEWFDISSTQVYLSDCHVEANVSQITATPITVAGDGGLFRMQGGKLLCGVGTAPVAADHIVQVDTAFGGGGAEFDGVFFANCDTATRILAGGVGRCTVRSPRTFNTSVVPRVISETASPLHDPGFEGASVVDQFITADTSTITSRTNGACIDLALSSAEFRSGAKSLEAIKAFGVGSASRFILAMVPVTHGAQAGAVFWHRKAGSQTGSWGWFSRWVRVWDVTPGSAPNYVDEFQRTLLIASSSVSLTSSAYDWTRAVTPQNLAAPGWATHFAIEIDLFSMGAGSIFFDDVVITASSP